MQFSGNPYTRSTPLQQQPLERCSAVLHFVRQTATGSLSSIKYLKNRIQVEVFYGFIDAMDKKVLKGFLFQSLETDLPQLKNNTLHLLNPAAWAARATRGVRIERRD